MCLYIGNKEGFILKKDLIVFKQISGDEKSGYRTPCQGWPVKLDTDLIPDKKGAQIERCGFKFEIGAGIIHAYLKTSGGDDVYKAIIPAGTRCWLQDDLTEIGAEKLHLTSEKIKKESEADLSEFISSGADVYLKDGSRKKITDTFSKEDVLGFFTKVGIVSINISTYTKFSEKPLDNFPSSNTIGKLEDAFSDLNGKKNTEELTKTCKDSGLLAIGLCRNTDEYLPSAGELMGAFKELEAINLSREFLGLDRIPLAWFWSSTVRNSSTVWICGGDGDQNWDYCDDCYFRGRVVPFLCSHEK
jgi:hypothetical protein